MDFWCNKFNTYFFCIAVTIFSNGTYTGADITLTKVVGLVQITLTVPTNSSKFLSLYSSSSPISAPKLATKVFIDGVFTYEKGFKITAYTSKVSVSLLINITHNARFLLSLEWLWLNIITMLHL